MTYPGFPDWDNNALSLGRPSCMDTPTLIEWIQRQLETLEETQARMFELDRIHREWHARSYGIYACCIKTSLWVDERAEPYSSGTEYEKSFGEITLHGAQQLSHTSVSGLTNQDELFSTAIDAFTSYQDTRPQ